MRVSFDASTRSHAAATSSPHPRITSTCTYAHTSGATGHVQVAIMVHAVRSPGFDEPCTA